MSATRTPGPKTGDSGLYREAATMQKWIWILVAVLMLSHGCSLERSGGAAHTTIEVAVFEGGYGIQWHKAVAREYERSHPGISVNLWGDPRVDEKIKPR